MQIAFGRVRRKSRITQISRIARILRGVLLVVALLGVPLSELRIIGFGY